jgi:hypothetical protein
VIYRCPTCVLATLLVFLSYEKWLRFVKGENKAKGEKRKKRVFVNMKSHNQQAWRAWRKLGKLCF